MTGDSGMTVVDVKIEVGVGITSELLLLLEQAMGREDKPKTRAKRSARGTHLFDPLSGSF